jgi:hypothetical protein
MWNASLPGKPNGRVWNFYSAGSALSLVAWRSSNTLSYINRHCGQW